ncbi:hypothetical protein KP509_32G069900 [Ceratopteris richardii]|uniref:Bifunctional inhibitor/plant lipid transfer protein/seed storage helical domain-containing protein n=1 Tax=Ceratopteris richardii TaxID=49495 RepID=A0A8T2QUG5_CERRI|nr:hypothetical protein KP509_32G069900 [Ceratopteris richardii]
MGRLRAIPERLCLFALFATFLNFELKNAIFANSQSPSCEQQLLNLQPCLPYYVDPKMGTPSAECCDPLKKAVGMPNVQDCFCALIEFARGQGISINDTRLQEIGRGCYVQIPSLQNCPSMAPLMSPSQFGSASIQFVTSLSLRVITVFFAYIIGG